MLGYGVRSQLLSAVRRNVFGKWTLAGARSGRGTLAPLRARTVAERHQPRTLSLRLRALEEEGIVERQTYAEVPPRVEYSLTAKGRALIPIIEGMRTYGERWLGAECATEPTVGLEPVAVAV